MSKVLWNFPAGKWVTIPDNRLIELYKTGDYAFSKNAQISMINKEGEQGWVDEANLSQALAAGSIYQPNAERIEANRLEEIRDMDFTAMALGAAQGLGGSMADWALKEAGVSERWVDEVTAENPIAAGGGRLGGFLLGIAGGPLTALGKGAQGTSVASRILKAGATTAGRVGKYSPTGAAVQLGVKVEKGVAGFLGAGAAKAIGSSAPGKAGEILSGVSLGGRIMATGKEAAALATPWAIGGLATDAALTANEEFGEQMLGNPTRTSEELIAHFQFSAALNGAFSLIPALGIRGVSNALRETSGKARNPMSKMASELKVRIVQAQKGGDLNEIRRLIEEAPETLRRAAGTEAESFALGMRDDVTELFKAVDEANKTLQGPARRQRLNELITQAEVGDPVFVLN